MTQSQCRRASSASASSSASAIFVLMTSFEVYVPRSQVKRLHLEFLEKDLGMCRIQTVPVKVSTTSSWRAVLTPWVTLRCTYPLRVSCLAVRRSKDSYICRRSEAKHLVVCLRESSSRTSPPHLAPDCEPAAHAMVLCRLCVHTICTAPSHLTIRTHSFVTSWHPCGIRQPTSSALSSNR